MSYNLPILSDCLIFRTNKIKSIYYADISFLNNRNSRLIINKTNTELITNIIIQYKSLLNPLVNYYSIEFYDALLSVNSNQQADGYIYNVSLTVNIDNLNPLKRLALKKLESKKLLIIVETEDNEAYILGLENGIKLFNSTNQGFNTVTFNHLSNLMPYFVSNAYIDSLVIDDNFDCSSLLGDIDQNSTVIPYYNCLVSDFWNNQIV